MITSSLYARILAHEKKNPLPKNIKPILLKNPQEDSSEWLIWEAQALELEQMQLEEELRAKAA